MQQNYCYYVGFWRGGAPFPALDSWTETPIENSATETQTEIIQLLEEKEEYCRQTSNVTNYFGCSFCRICQKPNGADEYRMDEFVWPSGYLHYLKEHNVQIDMLFQNFLLRDISNNNK